MMNKVIFFALFLLISLYVFPQQNDKSGHFGGPISTFASSKLGNSISFGGWGTFVMKANFHTGIYGQISTSIISKKSSIPMYNDYEIKNRFTGLWFGYYHSLKNTQKIHFSYFTKVGFGSVFLDNIKETTTIYDKAICITPSAEAIIKITSFMHLGIGAFYEIYSGVDFLEYKNSDFNAWGLSCSIRFCPSTK